MSASDQSQLLASMDAGRLVLLCGAGLSMAAPSNVPSAKNVAETCFDHYQLAVDGEFDPNLREDLESLAEYFAASQTLESYFIDRLVPWHSFAGHPNAGHNAVADLLIAGVFRAAVSTNFDALIERRAWEYGADFQVSLDGDEATIHGVKHGPLLKLHGCAHRDRRRTIWTQSQLNVDTISRRISKSEVWMSANLRNKDFLVVGFWSDWAYLNQIFSNAFKHLGPLSITVVDLADAGELEQKAPELWELSQSQHVRFAHIQECGAAFLDRLRSAFSTNYLRKLLQIGKRAFERDIEEELSANIFEVDEFDTEILYGWRRDAEGASSNSPATKNAPGNWEALSYFHLLLRRAGAKQTPEGYVLGNRKVRVVNGGIEILSSVKARFLEAPAIANDDMVVAVGATDFGLPEDVVRSNSSGDLVRPSVGGDWYCLEAARKELRI